jgi:hypothetical protein
MAQPKKQRSQRKTGLHRSHLVVKLARKVNSILSQKGEKVKVYTTKREAGKALTAEKAGKKPATKPQTKKKTAAKTAK